METSEKLVKIYIDLDNADVGSESFWAVKIGEELYELRNSPWYAFDLHFMDVVRAIPDNADEKPRIIEVIRQSGHKTLRVVFSKEIEEAKRTDFIQTLKAYRASIESFGSLYAISVEPEGDYGAVCGQLWNWEQEGLLEYETGATFENHELPIRFPKKCK